MMVQQEIYFSIQGKYLTQRTFMCVGVDGEVSGQTNTGMAI